ncbi:hypothetical protein GGR51DRAFT_529756 [Nemania sp. FL0031]|nr:hypothetical protein GGR51DRAFT_529756 [Nemania sp. FL0031]
MDALGLSTSRSNVACSSVEELQGRLHQLLATKTTDTRAEHISPSFEFLSHTPFYLPADSENALADGTGPDPAQSQQQLPIARTVIASETVQNQPADDPVLQKAVAKHISNAIGAVDSSAWTVRQVTRGAQGWQFIYICKDSLQAWNRANGKNPDRPVIGSYSGPGGLDPINLSRPAFDCRGTLTIAFSKSSRGIVVKYEHTPLHRTVTQLVDRLVPAPIPVPSASNGNQRTPKAKRPRLTDGEASARRRKTPKEKPAPVDGENSTTKKRTPRAKRPLPDGEENGEGSRKKRRKSGKASTADMGGLENAQSTPQSQAPSNTTGDKLGLTGFLNVPPAEAERRRQTAIELLVGKGIEPSTLSAEQFNIFANQAPNLQSASLDMLAKYGAERLRIVHPDEKEQVASSSNSTPATEQAVNTAAAPPPPPGNADTPTKKSRSKKRKSAGLLTEVSIGNGAVVPLEQGGGLGTTESALKPTPSRARKTRGRCETCKQRNAQCTKEHPSCSVCIGAGVDCVYLPPKPRRKSEKVVETIEQEDSNVGEENDDVQPEEASAGQTSDRPESHITIPPQPPPDIENEEFIPDPNILSGPVGHQTSAMQSASNTSYYQHSQSGINFPQISSAQAAASITSMPNFTYPEARNNEDATQPASGIGFPPTSTHTQQSQGPPASQPISASSTDHQAHSAASAMRKSLPTSQPKQTPIPPPTIPTHTSNWASSPPMRHSTSTSPKVTHQQAAKRSKSRKSKVEPEPQHDNLKHAAPQSTQYQSPMTRSPYQSAAYVNPRQGRRSQTNTPVATNSRPPPQPSSTTTHQPVTTAPSYTTTTASSSAPNYDPYPRYNNSNSGNEQYADTGADHNSSRITYESSSYQTNTTSTAPSSYSSIPSYDYGRASGTSNPLSQALNSSTTYNGTTGSTPNQNQWSTSQTRGAQNNSSSAYPPPANSASTSHGYSTRASDSRALNQNTSYSQSQSQPQSYNSYSSQQQSLNHQSQQNWYGFTAANSNNQASYANNRQSGHTGHRAGAPAYSSHYNGHEEQAIYDLLRTGSTNH